MMDRRFTFQTDISDERGFFAGLIEDLARELNIENLDSTWLFYDRTALSILFVVVMLAFLISVPFILAWYSSGIKKFHRSLTKKLNGKLKMDSTFVGYPLYPISVEGHYDGHPVTFETIQRDLYKPQLSPTPIEYYKRRYAKIFIESFIGDFAETSEFFEIRAKRFFPRTTPDGMMEIIPPNPVLAAEYEFFISYSKMEPLFAQDHKLKNIIGLSKNIPALRIIRKSHGFKITGEGNLKGEKNVTAFLKTLEFCQTFSETSQ